MGRERLAMTPSELTSFLDGQRVLRLATVDDEGWPAVVPVWFVHRPDEDGVGTIWVWNLNRAKRTQRLHDGTTRVGILVDGGTAYEELRGMTARADHAFVPDDEVPVAVRAAFGAKYFGMDGTEPMEHADDHTWLRLSPHTVRTWDFRKVM